MADLHQLLNAGKVAGCIGGKACGQGGLICIGRNAGKGGFGGPFQCQLLREAIEQSIDVEGFGDKQIIGRSCRMGGAGAACLARQHDDAQGRAVPIPQGACDLPAIISPEHHIQQHQIRLGFFGQRQRTAIARALAGDPRVLILDDALSAVDTATETKLLEHLRRAAGDRTVILAAHRLSVVAGTDQILVLEDGRPTGLGTHAELLAQHPWYRDAWRRQQASDELEELP